MTEPTITLCDECSDPIDTDPNGDAHSEVYGFEEVWWHPECCPVCNPTGAIVAD